MGKTLADELRRIRGVRGHSLRKVEELTGISNAYLSQLESGKAEHPSPHVLHKLAACYEVPYEELMKVAGYLAGHKSSTPSAKHVSALQAALMSASLNDEEETKVAEYIEFLRSQRRERGK